MMIEERDFNEWKQHPVTKAFLALILTKRNQMKDDWEMGLHSDETPEKYAFRSLAAMHECKAYALIADIEYKDFIPDDEAEGVSNGPGSNGK